MSFSVVPSRHPSQHPLFVFKTEEQARRQSANHSTVSETAVGASTTSVTKLERLTRMSWMKRMHAGITFGELFGTSLEFGLCHLSNTCCFIFSRRSISPQPIYSTEGACAGGEAFISFLGLPVDLFLLTITGSFPRTERSLALCPDADGEEPS